METGQRLKVSSDRLVKPGIKPATPGLQGKRFIHYTTAAPDRERIDNDILMVVLKEFFEKSYEKNQQTTKNHDFFPLKAKSF